MIKMKIDTNWSCTSEENEDRGCWVHRNELNNEVRDWRLWLHYDHLRNVSCDRWRASNKQSNNKIKFFCEISTSILKSLKSCWEEVNILWRQCCYKHILFHQLLHPTERRRLIFESLQDLLLKWKSDRMSKNQSQTQNSKHESKETKQDQWNSLSVPSQ